VSGNVKQLGYARIETQDLDAWETFACDVLGFMAAERNDSRLRLRMDSYVYRLEINKGPNEGISALGWDCGDEDSLAAIEKGLADAGYAPVRANADEAAARMVDELVTVRDPDGGFDLEFFWSLRNATERFVSPTDATFVAEDLGLGHGFQSVSDEKKYSELYRDILGFRLSDHIDFPNGGAGIFLHCNPRHHSMAIGQLPRNPGIGHLMFEVTDLDIVGRAYDKVLDGAAPLFSTLGRHTNDKMVSFYVGSPSGFGVEYGVGGVTIDDDETWRPTRYSDAHYWGHQRQPARTEAETPKA
jgi:2,3-dihydroxybiphenyl 1,2-dioxygenase